MRRAVEHKDLAMGEVRKKWVLDVLGLTWRSAPPASGTHMPLVLRPLRRGWTQLNKARPVWFATRQEVARGFDQVQVAFSSAFNSLARQADLIKAFRSRGDSVLEYSRICRPQAGRRRQRKRVEPTTKNCPS